MSQEKIAFILTDIEGTTTSVSFVYESLFPYFRHNIGTLKNLQQLPEVQKALEQTVELAKKEGEDKVPGKSTKKSGGSSTSQAVKAINQSSEKSTLGDLDALAELKEKMDKGE